MYPKSIPGRRLRRPAAAAVALLAAGVAVAACGTDSDSAKAVKVTAVDYAFSGLPATLKAGRTLELTNKSSGEAHELVAFRLPDSETRSVADILKLPEPELFGLFSGEPAAVLVAGPGAAGKAVVGTGVLSETGRYLVFCSIPVGADPVKFLAAAEGSDGPPDVPGGAPHFTRGMFAELTVK